MTLVWYAAYGSNLSRERFGYYLRGGTPPGANHAYPGSRDRSDPADDRPWEIDRELVFGGTSRTWGGGVALVDADASGVAKARLYLVTLDQFTDVLAQENWLEPGTVTLSEVEAELDLGVAHTYGLVLALGTVDGRPVLTFSQHRGATAAAPSPHYLGHIAQGLREVHSMTDDDIVDYLLTARGVTGSFTSQTLLAAVGSVG